MVENVNKLNTGNKSEIKRCGSEVKSYKKRKQSKKQKKWKKKTNKQTNE